MNLPRARESGQTPAAALPVRRAVARNDGKYSFRSSVAVAADVPA